MSMSKLKHYTHITLSMLIVAVVIAAIWLMADTFGAWDVLTAVVVVVVVVWWWMRSTTSKTGVGGESLALQFGGIYD